MTHYSTQSVALGEILRRVLFYPFSVLMQRAQTGRGKFISNINVHLLGTKERWILEGKRWMYLMHEKLEFDFHPMVRFDIHFLLLVLCSWNKTKMKFTELPNVGITNTWRENIFSYLKETRSLSLNFIFLNKTFTMLNNRGKMYCLFW